MPEARREDLMNAAERLFLDRGVEPTTVEEITRAAAVAKGTFYLHFASKTELLEALRERFVHRLLDGIVAAVACHDRPHWRDRLAAWSRACTAGYLDAATVHHLVFVAAPPPTHEGLSRNILIDHLAALLDAGTRDGAWHVADPSFTAVFLFNALHGVANQTRAGGDEGSRAALLAAVEEHVLRCVPPAATA